MQQNTNYQNQNRNKSSLFLETMNETCKKRITYFLTIFFFLFSIVIGKAFKIQILDKEALLERSRDQIVREATIYPKRGSILDRNGNPLAINTQTYSIFTIPKNLNNRFSNYKKLSTIIPSLPYRIILKKIKDRKRYTWLARKIPLKEEQVKQIKQLEGIYIEAVPKRIYPNGELLSQILGFVGIDNIGLSGVEYLFDKNLRGRPKVLKYIKDAKGRPIKFEGRFQDNENHDIVLSIDKDLQATVEKYLKEAVLKHNADGGGIGVLDVKTGEVMAMANYPNYDPNNWEHSRETYRKLPFVTNPMEPGSTFKILTIASALENKTARPDTNFYCERGELPLDGHVIREAEEKKIFEWLSVTDIIKYSSNIGTTKIAFDLTYPKLYETLNAFNIGEKTGIEIPGESRGIFSHEENISGLRLSNLSFGQGVAVTGIQMLSLYAVIANDGVYVLPTILKGKERDKRVVLSKQTAMELENMLVEAVENGTGTNAKVSHFVIAGKTGTAQRPDSEGGYRGHVASFIGYPINVENPFIIYVYIDNPKGKHYYGSTVAAPIFRKIAQYILYKDKDFAKLATIGTNDKNLDHVGLVQASTRKFAEGLVPSFLGLDKKNTKRIARRLKLNILNQGAGVVIEQSPNPGIKLQEDTVINLIYRPPKLD